MTELIVGRASRSLDRQVSVYAPTARSGNAFQLVLAIGTMMVCFGIFGSVAGMMPIVATRLNLTEPQVGLALAAPMLLGSVSRIVLGIFADRFGGRVVLIGVMVFSVIPALLLGLAHTYG